MSKYIDARGKACPMPVILAKKEIDGGEKNLTVTVDNE
ncbi:MAG: sulfurtransferase TusA family protein, partial [Clostridia bacterium]|nr:sulfurtransferase TusA family protein [Clostridia bacterium]